MLIESNLLAIEGTIRSIPLVTLDGLCLSGLETVGGWYQVIGNGKVFTLRACSLDISKNVGISVFTGNCSLSECIEHQSRQLVNCETGNGQAISFTSKPGIPYNVLVSGLPVGVGLSTESSTNISFESSSDRRRLEPELELETDFRLEFNDAEISQNSNCESSLPVTFETALVGSTVGLLTTYKTCQNTEKAGAWYTFVGGAPMEDGVIVYEANTCSPEFNFHNTMSVFRGDQCGSHKCVDVDVLPCPYGWFGQQVYWTSASNENYQIFVHSSDAIEAYTSDSGSFNMAVAYNNRSVNDQCNAALDVELDRMGGVKGTTSGSKPDINSIESSSCGTGGAGSWYRITGTGAVLQASTCLAETDHETKIQVYSGECMGLTCIDSGGGNEALCNDDKSSVVNFKTQVDVDYYILVTSREGKTGNFGLQIMEIQPPENNECSAAIPLGKNYTLGSTLQATNDFTPGHHYWLALDTPGVWYEIDGAGRGLEISTCQSNDFNSAISVFKGSCNSLESVTGTSAIDPRCTDGQGVVASFLSDKNTKYLVYVHGKSGSPISTGDFTVSYSEFDFLDTNEFCPSARSIPTDGSRVQVSTEDTTHASIPSSSCGVPISNPGLWYTFPGNGRPFEVSACSEDEVDMDVSVSVFSGGPRGCESLACLTGTTFVDNVCSSALSRRSLQRGSPLSNLRFMTQKNQDYFVFVHGTNGVGDFDLFVLEEDLVGLGTTAPTELPFMYGKDLLRWIPVDTEALIIHTDYLALDIIDSPSGNVTTQGYIINYVPPLNFSGVDIMTVDGCNEGKCYRFDVTITVLGKKLDPDDGGGEIWNKSRLLWMLLLLLIPCVSLPLYLLYQNKQRGRDKDDSDVKIIDTFEDDTFDQHEEGSLLNRRIPDRGVCHSSVDSGDLDPSSDDEDEGNYNSSDET